MPIDIHDLNARLAVVENTVNRVDKKVDGIASNLSDMKSYQDKQRGVIASLVVFSGVCGAAITKIVGYFLGKAGAV